MRLPNPGKKFTSTFFGTGTFCSVDDFPNFSWKVGYAMLVPLKGSRITCCAPPQQMGRIRIHSWLVSLAVSFLQVFFQLNITGWWIHFFKDSQLKCSNLTNIFKGVGEKPRNQISTHVFLHSDERQDRPDYMMLRQLFANLRVRTLWEVGSPAVTDLFFGP